MHNHEPVGYKCPMCAIVHGEDWVETRPSDIIYQDASITAFVSPKWWMNNPGHVIVIPNMHVENIYDIPDDIMHAVYSFAKKVAIAMKESYPCEGTSLRQHNEPAGNQDVWHYHVHVFPRYENDKLYQNHGSVRWTNPDERVRYADLLGRFFGAGKQDVFEGDKPFTAGQTDGTVRSNIRPGLRVAIVQKQDQPTGRLTEGIVRDILTSSSVHHRGIKVRLTSGIVGRVQVIHGQS